MRKYGYLVVEGPHDVWFAYRILSVFGLEWVREFDKLDAFWHQLVPRSFPHKGDLQRRVPVPLFLSSDTHSIAIDSARGDTRLAATVLESWAVLDESKISGIGLILDADDPTNTVAGRFAAVRGLLAQLGIALPQVPGQVTPGSPRCGIFVLPDNSSPGTLETILLDCGKKQYPSLLAGAEHFVNAVDPEDDRFKGKDMNEFTKPAGRSKAVINCVASILKPGKAIQVSIQDNRWVRDETLNLDRVSAVKDFLAELLGLS